MINDIFFEFKLIHGFLKQVDLQGICELTALNREPSSDNFRRLNLAKTKAFTQKAYRDLGNQGLYIYYGQEDGYYLQYPGMKSDANEDCFVFDPRTRYCFKLFEFSFLFSSFHFSF